MNSESQKQECDSPEVNYGMKKEKLADRKTSITDSQFTRSYEEMRSKHEKDSKNPIRFVDGVRNEKFLVNPYRESTNPATTSKAG